MAQSYPRLSVFGQLDTWEAFSQGLEKAFGPQGRNLNSLAPLLIGLGAFLLAAVIVALLAARYRRQSLHSPKRLFHSLCRAHRLGWKQSWALWQLARAQGLENPATLFVDPERFDPDYISLWLRPHRQLLLEVRDRVCLGLSGKFHRDAAGVAHALVHALPGSRRPGTRP